MFDIFGHFNVQNGGFQTAKSNSRAGALQMQQTNMRKKPHPKNENWVYKVK